MCGASFYGDAWVLFMHHIWEYILKCETSYYVPSRHAPFILLSHSCVNRCVDDILCIVRKNVTCAVLFPSGMFYILVIFILNASIFCHNYWKVVNNFKTCIRFELARKQNRIRLLSYPNKSVVSNKTGVGGIL